MPELPEVETVKRQLSNKIISAEISGVELSGKKMRYTPDATLISKMAGEKILHLHRRNKYLVIETNSLYLLFHLGMSGQLKLVSSTTEKEKHEHVSILLGNKKLALVDPRRFGGFVVYEKINDWLDIPLFSNLGIEPFGDKYTLENFKAIIKKENIKKFLLDAHNICGVGNIYANEIMFKTGINPHSTMDKLTDIELENIFINIKEILQLAIDNGGSSISDFVHVNGESGKMQNLYKVYNREGKPCLICQTNIKKIKQFGRSTYYCPKCQS